MTQHVIVTGGAGYIGSHACQALAAAGFVPVVYDNLSTGVEAAVKFGPLERGDIRDGTRFLEVLQQYKPVAVMHFAALIKVGESVEQPADYYHVNTLGAWTVLNALRTYAAGNSLPPFVFSSTAAVYGIPEGSPIAEGARLEPINPYGQSKLAVERMLADYAAAYGLPYAALRYFNAAGASLDGSIGLNNRNPSHLIPSILEVALGTRPAFQMFGTDYPTPDGTAVRDYIHVVDLANAHVAALKHLLGGGQGGAFNLGTGSGFSVKEVVDAVEAALGQKVPVVANPRRAGDPPTLVADSTKAQSTFRWKPEHSDLATIVRTGWEWRKTLA